METGVEVGIGATSALPISGASAALTDNLAQRRSGARKDRCRQEARSLRTAFCKVFEPRVMAFGLLLLLAGAAIAFAAPRLFFGWFFLGDGLAILWFANQFATAPFREESPKTRGPQLPS